MQSRPAPRRRQARAALLLTVAAAALAACLVVLTPALAAPRSGEITSSSVLRGPMSNTYSLIVGGPAGIYAVGTTREHNIDVLVSRNTFTNRNLGHFSWSNPNNMNGADIANAVAGDRFGNVIVVGNTEAPAPYSNWDLMVLKVSPRMELQWSVVLDGGALLPDYGNDVTCDHAGNVYVTGMRSTAQGKDFWTMKLAAKDGRIVWQTSYDAGLDDGASALCLDARGNVYVAGYSQNAEADQAAHGVSDLVTVKYDRRGVQQWATRTDSPLHDLDGPRFVALGRSGALFVAGQANVITGSQQARFWVVRLTTDGRERWQSTLDSSPWKDTAYALAVGPDNSAYMTGTGMWYDPADFLHTLTYRGTVARWDSSGKLLWAREKVPPTPWRVELRDILVDDEGNAWCAGWQQLPGSGDRAIVIKYSARGRELWTSTWDDPADTNEKFLGLALVGHNVLAAGSAHASESDYDAAIVGFRR